MIRSNRSGAISRSAAQQSHSYLANSFPLTEPHQSNTLANSEKLNDKNQNLVQEHKSELNLPFDLTFSEFESNSEKLTQNLVCIFNFSKQTLYFCVLI